MLHAVLRILEFTGAALEWAVLLTGAFALLVSSTRELRRALARL